MSLRTTASNPEDLADTAVLNAAQLEDIARTSISIEQLLHRPQDIEFCFDTSLAYGSHIDRLLTELKETD